MKWTKSNQNRPSAKNSSPFSPISIASDSSHCRSRAFSRKTETMFIRGRKEPNRPFIIVGPENTQKAQARESPKAPPKKTWIRAGALPTPMARSKTPPPLRASARGPPDRNGRTRAEAQRRLWGGGIADPSGLCSATNWVCGSRVSPPPQKKIMDQGRGPTHTPWPGRKPHRASAPLRETLRIGTAGIGKRLCNPFRTHTCMGCLPPQTRPGRSGYTWAKKTRPISIGRADWRTVD